jgi:hypothetical protein
LGALIILPLEQRLPTEPKPFDVAYTTYSINGVEFVAITVTDMNRIVDRNREQAAELRRLEERCRNCCNGAQPPSTITMATYQSVLASYRADLKRREADYAVLLQANHRLGFGSVDIKAELAIARRDLATVREQRDKLIESNRNLRTEADRVDDVFKRVQLQRNAAWSKLDAFGAVMASAAEALEAEYTP